MTNNTNTTKTRTVPRITKAGKLFVELYAKATDKQLSFTMDINEFRVIRKAGGDIKKLEELEDAYHKAWLSDFSPFADHLDRVKMALSAEIVRLRRKN
jgi:hypothetical protein